MQGDPEVIEFLNEQLTAELTAINQYFLHAKMQENFGWVKLAKHTRAESFDEMRHAEILTDRIIFLEGLPNYQRLFHVRLDDGIWTDRHLVTCNDPRVFSRVTFSLTQFASH